MQDYTERGRADPAVLAMADRVTYRSPERGVDDACRPGVEIRTRDGRVLTKWVDHVPGDPARPADQVALEAKFRDCAACAARSIPPTQVERAVELVHDLEHLTDATEIIRALTPTA
jgi:2-methylcitrate dehydratase PrpD